jgi:hypothetical protein
MTCLLHRAKVFPYGGPWYWFGILTKENVYTICFSGQVVIPYGHVTIGNYLSNGKSWIKCFCRASPSPHTLLKLIYIFAPHFNEPETYNSCFIMSLNELIGKALFFKFCFI